jgi:NAD(P)-dependent dehydrogenase (short-subunit alcohol dehydrogenase family)
MTRTGRLEGRRIVLTGAASGIGRATAELFVEEGARVALLDRDAAALADVAGALSVPHFLCELGDEASIRQAIAASAEALGGLDGVANIAGMLRPASIDASTLEDWNRVMAVNLTAPFLVCREALPHLRQAEGAAIVNVSSGSALLPIGNTLTSYAASKAGLIAFSKALASELAPHVRVNVLCPGAVDTPMILDSIRALAVDAERSPYALRRLAEPREIAEGILYLISSASTYVTGITLAVDGGRTFH